MYGSIIECRVLVTLPNELIVAVITMINLIKEWQHKTCCKLSLHTAWCFKRGIFRACSEIYCSDYIQCHDFFLRVWKQKLYIVSLPKLCPISSWLYWTLNWILFRHKFPLCENRSVTQAGNQGHLRHSTSSNCIGNAKHRSSRRNEYPSLGLIINDLLLHPVPVAP